MYRWIVLCAFATLLPGITSENSVKLILGVLVAVGVDVIEDDTLIVDVADVDGR